MMSFPDFWPPTSRLSPNRLPCLITLKMPMIKKAQRELLRSLVVHEKRVHDRNHAEVASAGQSRALHRDDRIIVAGDERVEALAIAAAAGQDAELKVRRRQLGL